MTNENLILSCTASLRSYIDGSNIGLPVTYLSQEEDNRPTDQVMVELAYNLRRRGSAGEDYLVLSVTASIRTRHVETDVYYHARICARVVGILSQQFPCKDSGYKGASNAVVGSLRPIPLETTNLGPIKPNESIVEAMFEFQPCG